MSAGAALLLAAGGGPRTAAAGGLVLGLLPWLKSEGFPLAVLALAAALWSSRSVTGPDRRRWAPAAAACAAVGLGAWAIGRFVLPQGASFFLGDWWGRGVERLTILPAIAAFCLEELLAADWLGFWPLLALASIAALALRRRAAAALAAAVWLQLAIYAATALFTYLEPVGHLRAAFFRIAAALVAPGLLAIAHLLAPAERVR
ncbi:MAG TPA: hypothetical protein VHM02_09245 [Thermoanaerobaculia bacterium]|nr:hypothetical protein [Thermoanaerobaculia bacterium]